MSTALGTTTIEDAGESMTTDGTIASTGILTAPGGRVRAAFAVAAAVATLLVAAFADDARADFGFADFDGAVSDASGGAFTQAGGHPASATTIFQFNSHIDDTGAISPDGGGVKDLQVDLPAGFVGNPTVAPTCRPAEFAIKGPGQEPNTCPASTQVGVATVALDAGLPFPLPLGPLPVYNLEAPPGQAATFAFKVFDQIIYLAASVRPGDYGVRVTSRNTSEAARVIGTAVTLWGVPADPSHDPERYCQMPGGVGCSTDTPRRPFLTNPTACTPDGEGLVTRIRANPWDDPSNFAEASFESHLPPGFTDFFAPLPPDQWGAPQGPDGCENVPFDPEISVRPTTTVADSPTGLVVDLSVPIDGLENPAGIAQANLKRATVTLPEGMAVNPSSADGLGACSPSQIALGSDAASTCPAASKIGTVRIDTPLLEEPLAGSVYLATPDDNPFGSLLAMYITAVSEERGIFVKLAGHVEADPESGVLRTTFDDNPQVPFSNLHLELKSGPRAPLVTPPACGPHTVQSQLTPWSAVDPDDPTADEVVTRTSSFSIDCPGEQGFTPSLEAGSVSAVAGAFSPFAVRIGRPDRSQVVDGVSLELPTGMLAKLRGVGLCPDSLATDEDVGPCPSSSRIGTATVAAGAGSNPFGLEGDVYLTGPYKGGPYGLSVQVRAKAGPLDLGMVKVRQAIRIDPVDAHLTVASDPLPTIREGIPFRLRTIGVEVDRPQFAVNPTSCEEKRIEGTLHSAGGLTVRRTARFQVGDCAALGLRPKLSLGLTGKRQRGMGRHPGLRAVLTQPSGDANLERVRVALPRAIVLDARRAADPSRLCSYEDGLEADCPASTVIGRAVAQTPLLDRPLTGPVHFVQGIRFDKRTGNRIRTLPTLLVKLRGQVAIDVRARTNVSGGRLVTTFPAVPDAPISKFTLSLASGRSAILVTSRDVCKARTVAKVRTDGQNGKRRSFGAKVAKRCGASKRRR